MKEDMLQNDTEDIRQKNSKTPASGNSTGNDVKDLTEDEWDDTGFDGNDPELKPALPESFMPVLKTVAPIACAALLILLLIIAGLSGKKTEKK